MAWKRARSLENWLRALIRTYRDPRSRPRDRTFSNLTSLESPTQIYGVVQTPGWGNAAAFVITHDEGIDDGATLVVRVSTLQELAAFSEVADEVFGTSGIEPEYHQLGDLVLSPLRVGEQSCIHLAELTRSPRPTPVPQRGTFHVSSMTILQVVPSGALWQVRYRSPLPPPATVLRTVGDPPQRRKRARPERRPATPTPPPAIAYAAYAEPLIWFGNPPFPSAKDRILRPLRIPRLGGRRVAQRSVASTSISVYETGLVLAHTHDRVVARAVINQVFAAISRSGIPSLLVPDDELIEVTSIDAETGEPGGSRGAVTPRNALLGPPTSEPSLGRSAYLLPEEVGLTLLQLAEETVDDPLQAVASLRLLAGTTLSYRSAFSEAFVMGWSLIERWIERAFREFWTSAGRSSKAIKDMDWQASQQIDLLLAIGRISKPHAREVHVLRKRRNDIVHRLQEATEKEALDCLETAEALMSLPSLEPALQTRRFYF